ncbi:MAG: hypothetical protein LBN02_06680 [Oscillospiraceae bacterium]|jgi:hypothetical protein|nr:hypothetical protein [Oscillospiraceae bacterium]
MAKATPRSQLNEITDRLEKGVGEMLDSEKFAAYLKTMSRFHSYSTRNTLLAKRESSRSRLSAGLVFAEISHHRGHKPCARRASQLLGVFG